jgi:hypothetical protein
MVHGERCDLSTRFALKDDVLLALNEAGGLDMLRVELDLDRAYQAERFRMGTLECNPDGVQLFASSLSGSIDNLVKVIANGGEYPEEPKRGPASEPQTLTEPPTVSFASPRNLVGTKIFYGSRAGMSVTIQAASGVDTAAAVIESKITEEDAVSNCAESEGQATDACIASQLEIKLAPSISANCETGVFQDFLGNRYQFMGPRNSAYGETQGNYTVIDLTTRAALDGSMASGYYTTLGLFEKLCPTHAPTDEW